MHRAACAEAVALPEIALLPQIEPPLVILPASIPDALAAAAPCCAPDWRYHVILTIFAARCGLCHPRCWYAAAGDAASIQRSSLGLCLRPARGWLPFRLHPHPAMPFHRYPPLCGWPHYP